MDIYEKINRYADLKFQADAIHLHFYELRNQLIPPELKDPLADLAEEEKTALETQQAGLAALESEIKLEVLTIGATIKTPHYQAIYQKGRISWDIKALEGYAAAHPEIVKFRKQGDPSISLRPV